MNERVKEGNIIYIVDDRRIATKMKNLSGVYRVIQKSITSRYVELAGAD